jgi:hypothetical protein
MIVARRREGRGGEQEVKETEGEERREISDEDI